MTLGCLNAYGTMSGPLNVAGAQVGANCEQNQTLAAVCSLSANQGGWLKPAITGFTMKTTCAPHAPSVESLPFSGNWASYYGPVAQHPDSQFGICVREFICKIGSVLPNHVNTGVVTQQIR